MVLDLVRNVDDTFYLTGGTALGRIYLRHRYSDDLYLFVNREEKFKDLSNNIISQLQKHFSMIEMALLGEDFARIFIHHDNGLSLKIEMVNDVLFRVGEIQAADFFHRVDSWQNILSNKVCALSRDEAKDIADIIFLSSKYNFVWEAMINHARQKDNWVNEIIVSKMIYEFDIRRLRNINWIEDPEYETLQQACTIISRDILDGGENSLPQQSGDH
ncbi:MAG: nucleotidyl transferase AbiEii/AbiGii toxin family protein [Thermodesulfobacteriota bacterium]|nr:nucleotidyl transferase AbiEii/AbiGii toxin family protein [Thermodesulfobacteriota bacterium]